MKLKLISARTLMASFWILAGTGCLRCCEFGEDAAASTSTCDEETETCEPWPDDCTAVLPELGRLTLAFSSPLPIEVRVYEGEHFETGRLAKVWVPADTVAKLDLPYARYAATALYVRDGDTVLVVDGDGIGYETIESCQGTCYEAENGEMDLKLRE